MRPLLESGQYSKDIILKIKFQWILPLSEESADEGTMSETGILASQRVQKYNFSQKVQKYKFSQKVQMLAHLSTKYTVSPAEFCQSITKQGKSKKY